MALIYIARSITTGRPYVGLTTLALERRKSSHKIDIKRGVSTKFYNAVRKYGWDDFVWSVAEDGIPVDKIGEAEDKWIKALDSIENGYNTIPGGNVSPMLNPDIVAKASAAQKGRVPWNKGIPRTDQEKENIRAARLLAPKKDGPSPLLGRKLSDDHRAAISASLIGNTRNKGKAWTGDREQARERMIGNSRASALKGKPKSGKALDAVRTSLAKARAVYAAQKATKQTP